MPNSRRRKKQVIASRRQLERSRRKLSLREAEGKENQASASSRDPTTSETGKEQHDSTKGWWDWCTSGVSQVRVDCPNHMN